MKSFSYFTLTLAAVILAHVMAPALARGATTVNFSGLNQLIPDGNINGWSDQRTISVGPGLIDSLTVSLNITGGFNGDLYAQLTHSSGFSVLLNRVGRSLSNPSGYSDSGFDVQFDDNEVSAYDVHEYRLMISGLETTPILGPLTGIWRPDARVVDPSSVLNSHARTAFLSSFNGLDPNGEWTLFIADMDAGGQSTVQSWGLTMLISVPEPRISALLLLAGTLGCGFGRSRKLSI